jgi:hypothetical protein
VWAEWSVRARDDAVVVEHAQRSDAHLVRIAISVEGEVPASIEPAAFSCQIVSARLIDTALISWSSMSSPRLDRAHPSYVSQSSSG